MEFRALENVAELAPQDQPTVPFSIDLDRSLGIILVQGAGFWSSGDVDQHFDDLAHMVQSLRNAGTPIRALVDLRSAGVQAVGVVERIGPRTRSIYTEDDRIAIVVSSSLAKMQLRRRIQSLRHEFFLSPNAAVTWLRAHH